MIEIQDLRFSYPRSGFRLHIDHLAVPRGQRVAVTGPSGSGKTTLLNLISGISLPESGRVGVGGAEVSSMSDVARRAFRVRHIGFVFQQFELVEYLPVRENILLPYLISRSLALDESVRRRVEELAEATGIRDKLDRRVRQLSQGEQQRVAICRALLPSPQLILADEPTGNLDPANKHRILELLFSQCVANELTLVAVTHDASILDGFDRTLDFGAYHAGKVAV
jgi:putative ABC transport system ATP-binding protein